MKQQTVKYGKRGGEEILVTKDFMPTEEGQLAIDFAHHFAIVAAVEDGVDEAGRAKFRLQTVDEVVKRSCDLAEQLIAEMRKRNWILDLPTPKPAQLLDLEDFKKAFPPKTAGQEPGSDQPKPDEPK